MASSTAFAQGVDFVQSDLMPGAILQDLQQKTVPSETRPDLQKQPLPAPLEGVPPVTESQPEGQNTPEEKILITRIQVEDVGLIPESAIASIVAPYEKRELTFSEIQALCNQLTSLYREKGYVTSRVYVPPQKMRDGVLTLKALEGTLGEVKVEEGRFFKRASVLPQLSLRQGEPFNVEILSRDLRRLNMNPDRTVRAALKPGQETGETEIELEIEDRLPVHFTPSFDNLGRESIGIKRFGVLTEHNNLLGLGDRAMSSVSLTRRSFGIVSQYQLPIGDHGTSIGFEHAYSRLKLGGDFEALNVEGRASTYTPFMTQELLNTRNHRVSLDLAFDFKTLDTDVLDADFSNDRLRILRPALTWEGFDNNGRTYIRNEFGIGLDVLSGTIGDEPTVSRTGAGTKFFSYTASVIRTQKLPFDSFGILRLIGQASPDRLVSSQQFQAGGSFTVRGYREGSLIGDRGLVTSMEIRTPIYFLPQSWKIPGTRYSLRKNIQFVTFADYGAVYTNKPSPGIDGSEYILGLGLGLRAQLTRRLIGRVDWGFPVLKQADNNGPRIHFGLQSNLF